MKTFWTGIGGWADTQLPDGTLIWTAPSGRTYTTKPGGALLFPILATPTGEITVRTPITEPAEGRGVMMSRTRYQEQPDRITIERAINEQRLKQQQWLIEQLEKHRQTLAANDPPLF